MKGLDINEQWALFETQLKGAIEDCVPKITVNNSQKLKHKKDSEESRKLNAKIKKKQRLWKKFRKENDWTAREEYNKVRNQVRRLTRNKLKMKEIRIAENVKDNPKLFWNHVQKKTKTKSSIPELYKDSDTKELTKSDGEKADVLADFFGSVFTSENESSMPDIKISENVKPLTECTIDEEDIKKRLRDLKVGKSPGPDGIHPRVLKELHEVLSIPLKIIFEESIRKSSLPEVWKTANITALFKKGDKKNPGNYRPVSLTCILCKVLESIIREKIVTHMQDHKLFSKKQFGFISGRSTVLQLLKVLDRWTEILDEGGCIDVAYCDFMKAFDKVPHNRLLHKLKMYKIGDVYISWLEAFLKGRKQRVTVNGTSSTWRPVTSGIPQGSVMGPIMFVLYINDLPDCLKNDSELYLYADDTKIFRKIKCEEDCQKLQEDIECMQNWSDTWLLRFHPEKCKYMRIGATKVNNFQYKLKHDQEPMEKSKAEKDVGVIIDENLSFEKHMVEKINKANSVLGAIRRSFQFLDNKTFKLLYTSLVRPLLEYANPVWNPYKIKHIDMLENVQRRATKIMHGMEELSYPERLRKIGLPSLTYRRHRGDMIEVYKILSNRYDPDVSDIFTLRDTDITRGHNCKIYKEQSRLEIRRNSFKNRVVELWNCLPNNVVTCKTTQSFERNLDRFWQKQENRFDYRAQIKSRILPQYSTYEEQELTLQVAQDLLSEEDL